MPTTAPATEEKAEETKDEQEAKREEQKPEEKKPEEKKAGATGAAPKLPKPVEVVSVPQTPLNNQTPAGGSPRPELKIDEEPEEAPQEAQVILGPADEADTNGASEDIELKDAPASDTGSESAKRKLNEEPAVAAVATSNGDASQEKNGSNGRAGKKARVEDVPAAPARVGRPPANGKAGKAKREKKVEPAVGRTARKTRSQGPVEV